MVVNVIDTCCSCPVSSHIGKKRTFDFKYIGKQVEDSSQKSDLI